MLLQFFGQLIDVALKPVRMDHLAKRHAYIRAALVQQFVKQGDITQFGVQLAEEIEQPGIPGIEIERQDWRLLFPGKADNG